jgi:hypothetical protein
MVLLKRYLAFHYARKIFSGSLQKQGGINE